jgi:uncharacterized RDD family membrane protein YckC
MAVDGNPYDAPQARVEDSSTALDADLPSRWLRLAGAIIDGIAVGIITVPVMVASGYWKAAMSGVEPSLATQVGWSVFGLAVFLLVHGYLLHRNGQTLAKRLLGMKIVDLGGAKPQLAKLVGLRYFVPQLIYLVPVVGMIIGLVGILLIFRSDRRPLHDLIAGTRVVRA